MNTETLNEAVERLRNQGEEELYSVSCAVTEEGLDDQLVWNVYRNIEDVLRWIRLCNQYWGSKPGFEEGAFPFEEVERKCRTELATGLNDTALYLFTLPKITQSFIIKRHY